MVMLVKNLVLTWMQSVGHFQYLRTLGECICLMLLWGSILVLLA